MKSVKTDGGKLSVCISEDDARLLYSMRKYLRPELFNEPGLANMTLNEDGLIDIKDPANVHYIRCMGFIPYEHFLATLDGTIHGKLWDRAVADYEGLHYLLHASIESQRPIGKAEAHYLKTIGFLEPAMVEKIIYLPLLSDEAYQTAQEIGECLKLQGQAYVETVFNAYEEKRKKNVTTTPQLVKKLEIRKGNGKPSTNE